MPMTTPNHHANIHDVSGRGAKPLILVVDDSNVARTFIRLIFQNDFEVHEASSGAEALEMLRTGAYNYSAILLDLVMPEEDDGWAVLKFLRESGIIKTVPVVVETASAIDLEIVTELYESGAWKVVGKPFDGKMLLALVKNACARANAAAAIASAGGELNAVREGTAAAVCAVDAATGKIVRANGRFNALVGYPRTVGFTLADVVGQNAELFNGVVRNTVDSGSGGPVLVDSLRPSHVDVLFCELMKCSGARHDLVGGTLTDITAMANRLRELEAAVASGRRS